MSRQVEALAANYEDLSSSLGPTQKKEKKDS